MRLDSAAFSVANGSLSKDPRYAIEIAFDDTATDVVYITSHDDTPLPDSVTSYKGVLKSFSATSQRLNPEKANASIGNIAFVATDFNKTIRQLLASKYVFGRSLKGKRIRAYMNYKGKIWSDAALVQTQVVDKLNTLDGGYSFDCSDVQRFLKKKIFVLGSTTLQNSVSITATTISVYDTSKFLIVAHGASYSDAPNQSVYYFKIEKEIIRATGKTSTTFTGCTRGVLNTKAVAHNINPSASADRRTKVEEVVYLEMPAPKLLLALLTGELHGQGANLPDAWHAGINPTYVRTASITDIGLDLWDTSDDTKGQVVRFVGEKNQDAKKFIEEQILLLIGCYMPIHGDGALGLRRMVQVLPDAHHVTELNIDNTTKYSALKHDLPEVKNIIDVAWNYEVEKNEATRHHLLFDQTSINIYGKSDVLQLKFRGLHGSLHTGKTIEAMFERLRDRLTSEPLKLTLSGFFSLNNIEIGDVVKVNLPSIQDYIKDGYLNRAFEVQRVNVDWITGRVSFDLFGSTLKSTPSVVSDTTTVLSDAFYISEGNDLKTYIGGGYDATSDYLANHIIANTQLTGGNDLTNATAIYYHDGDLVIDAGVTLTIQDNVQLRVKGFLTNNGIIDGKGNGYATASQQGYVGSSRGQGGIVQHLGSYNDFGVATTIGKNASAPELALIYDRDNEKLNGLPADLRGSTGTAGGNITSGSLYRAGGNAGNSGAGLLLISRGHGFGVSGKVTLSGTDGNEGQIASSTTFKLFSGAGAGGSGGTFYSILDGSTALATIGASNFEANTGASPYVDYGGIYFTGPHRRVSQYPPTFDEQGSSHYPALSLNGAAHFESNHRVQYVPNDIVAIPDDNVGNLPAPTLLAAQSGTGLLLAQPDGTIVPRVLLTFVAAIDERIVGYEVQYKLSSDLTWITSTNVLGSDSSEAIVIGVVTGQVYDFRIRSASGDGNTSPWLEKNNYTVIGKTLPPSDVSNVKAYFNNGLTIIIWDAISDLDAKGYDIRYGKPGILWANATPITSLANGTSLTTANIPDGTYDILIKAVDTSNNYSVNETKTQVTVTSAYDVIYTYFDDQFLGTLTNLVKHWTGGLLPMGQSPASNQGWETFDQAVPDPYPLAYYEPLLENDLQISTSVRVSSEIESTLHPASLGVADPTLQLKYSDVSETYPAYLDWSIGEEVFRYFRSRIKVDSSKGIPVIKSLNIIADAKEKEETGTNITIDATGTTINFNTNYFYAPFVEIFIQSATPLLYTLENLTKDSVTVHLFNTSNVEVAGIVNYRAIGV